MFLRMVANGHQRRRRVETTCLEEYNKVSPDKALQQIIKSAE